MLNNHTSRNVNRFVGRPDLPDGRPPGADDAPTSLWWSVLASFAEGFGAYSVALYPTADFPVHEVLVARRDAPLDRGGRAPAARWRAHASGPLPENVVRLGDGLGPDARPERHRSWLAFLHDKGASLWAHRRREREIKRAVAALGQFDDRTLRDMGISSRSEIEQVVRYCHDC